MKKVLSLVLSLCMLVSTMAVPAFAFADEPIKVQYSVCDEGMFTLVPTDVEVAADLSDKYADVVGYNDSSSNPTVLDATIAAHIAMFGEEEWFGFFTIDTSEGWAKITSAFGEETANCGYNVNGASAYGITQEVSNNDYIEFMFYQDAGYGDLYVTFDKRYVDAELGSTVTLTATYVSGYDYANNYAPIYSPAAGLDIVSPDFEFNYGVTDSKGQISIPVDTAMKVTATGTINSKPIFAPYCEINDVSLCYEVGTKMYLGAQYLIENGATTDLNKAFDTYNLFRAGVGDADLLVRQVTDNLAKNDGKLVVNNSESAVVYACVINSFACADIDYTNINGVNLAELLVNCKDKTVKEPYWYRAVIEACTRIGDINLAKTFADDFIKGYYVMGKGMDYWGVSCDNTAVFLAAIAPLQREYASYIADAKNVLKHYVTSDGCFYNDEYTDISPDSTATAVMAYAAIGEDDMAAMLLSKLYASFEDSKLKGVIDYYGQPNEYATKDAVYALTYINPRYNHILEQKSVTEANCTTGYVANYQCKYCDHKASYTDTRAKGHKLVSANNAKAATCGKSGKQADKVCSICNEVVTKGAVIKATGKHTYDAGVVTKAPTSSATGVMTYTCKVCKAKKTASIAKLAKVSGLKLTAQKKGFKVSWKKASSATGYEIQYATDSKFKKNKKTVTVSKNSTVSKSITKLSAKKKYYVRVRTYKTINGKKYYGSWTGSKSVTTKK